MWGEFGRGLTTVFHGVIVERDAAARETLVRVLSSLAWEVRVCEQLDEAKSYASEAWAVFLGAELLGEEALSELAQFCARYPDLAIVVVADPDQQPVAAQFEAAGVDRVLTRPIDEAALVDAVGEALLKRR